MFKLKKSVSKLVEEARQHIDNHSAEEAQRRVQEENALLVDIRDIRELQREGVIPGAYHAPRGMLEFWFDPDSPYFKQELGDEREYILF